MISELGHLLLKRHQRPPDLLDLVVGERALIHSPQGLPFHQLAQQFDDREDQAHQPPLDRLWIRVDAMAPRGRGLLRGCRNGHVPGTSGSASDPASALTDVTRARSETVTNSTSAMERVTSPLTTTPPASTRSSRSTRAIRSVRMGGRSALTAGRSALTAGRSAWAAGSGAGRCLMTAVGTSTGSTSGREST